MVNKDELINKLVEFLDIKLTNLSKDNQLVNVFIRPIFSRIINNNIGKVNQALSIIADENGMIDADGILNDMIDNLIISPVKEERGIKIGAGNVEIKIPFINKAIALDKDDINEATYQVDNMYHTDNKGNKITSPMFTPIDVRKLYDKKFKSINSNITFWDVYVALNAQYHDNIELYKEWFGEDNIENIKDKIIKSAIVNWFEDEDAGIEKVWNYFRAI